MTLVLNNKQFVPLSVSFQDAAGADVIVTGIPIWSSSNEAAVTLVTDANGLSTVARTVDGAVLNSDITVTLGAIVSTITINVVNEGDEGGTGTAVASKITAGTVQLK